VLRWIESAKLESCIERIMAADIARD